MSVAIAELNVSMNQDAFHPKIETQQNSLFEDAMREIYVQDGISSQKEILAVQKTKQNAPDPLVDSVIDPTILVVNSKDSKIAATYIAIEQQHVNTQDVSLDLDNSLNSFLIDQKHFEADKNTKYPKVESIPFVEGKQSKQTQKYTDTTISKNASFPIEIQQDLKDFYGNANDKMSDAIEQQYVEMEKKAKDPKVESIPFVEEQQPTQTEEYSDAAIIKNTSFFVETPKDFRDLHNGNDDKMSAFYPNANYMLHEKNNVDIEANDVTISDFKKLDQSLFQLNDAEFLLQNIKFQDNKLPINVENKANELQKESPQAETLKLLNPQNTNDQVMPAENKVNKLLEETPQAETLKLLNHQNTNQQSVQSRESPVKIDVFSTPTILSTSDNSKEFTLIGQSSTVSQTNEQNQSIIGLKMGNITNQDGVQSLKISILPQELGTINLDLKTNAETKLTEAHFTFSNQDGFDLFQGNRQDLLALLGKSGLDIQPDKVSFDLLNFADSSSQFAHEHPKNDQDLNQKTHFFRGENNEPSLEEMIQIQNNVTTTSLLNLMI